MTEIFGSLGLKRRTLFDRRGGAIGNVEELHSGAPGGRSAWPRVGTGVLVGPGGAASTPRTAREPVSAGGTPPAL